MTGTGERQGFVVAVQALQPYMHDLVIVGGWVPTIYHHCYADPAPDEEPPGTTELDVVLPPALPAGRRASLHDLLIHAGYQPITSSVVGEARPRLKFERALAKGLTSEVEMLTPARGGRRGIVRITGQEALTAEALPYHNLLLQNALDLVLTSDFDSSISKGLVVCVPKPAAFVYAKGLTWQRRQVRAKRAKDLAYLVDMISRYPSLRQEVLAELPELFASYPRKWHRDFRNGLAQAFSGPASAGSRMVADQLTSAGLAQGSAAEEGVRVYAVVAGFLRQLEEARRDSYRQPRS